MIIITDYTIPRMRTAANAIKEIKKIDPDTAFTERALRRMINTGEIPVTKVGNRKLINLDLLLAKLSGGCYNGIAARVS